MITKQTETQAYIVAHNSLIKQELIRLHLVFQIECLKKTRALINS